MNINFKGVYKSLTDFEWNDVPLLSVITGPNGAGKTQLLELVYKTLTKDINTRFKAEITDVIYKKGEVSFLKSEWILNNSQPINLVSIQQEYANYHGWLNNINQMQQYPKLELIIEEMALKLGKPRQSLTREEFDENFPAEFLQDENQVTQQINRIFLDYNLSLVEETAAGISEEDIIKKIGPKPWVLLNEIMREANLPFSFNHPEPNKIKTQFKLEITDDIRNAKIEFNDLSSGEKVLVSLVFFLYTSQEKKYFPKFLILDEPDAHLHPSMAKQFLDVINNIFVKRHNIRVMITTHSPSTVALTPEENLFEMNRTLPRIKKSTSKNKTISLLTAGLVIVGVGTKYFLVEDEDDVKFYQEIYSYFISKNKLSGAIPFVFMPSSTNNKSGGKSQVYSWVKKLKDSGLDNIIQGIIDKDSGNQPSAGIYILNRYSFENYLLDPIVVYAALMDRDLHVKISDISLHIGEEYKLATLNYNELQKIADVIHSKVEPFVERAFPDFDASEKTLEPVEIISGKTLQYPRWLINRRGKTLLHTVYHNVFPSNSINPTTLTKAFKKIHFLPQEMLDFFTLLEKSS